MNFSAQKQQIKPPERGSFPLDHAGECKPFKEAFLACMKEHGSEHINCKPLSKQYLQCRMDRGLMARDDLAKVGFGDDDTKDTRGSRVVTEGQRESAGFVAGLHIEERKSLNPFRWTPRGGGH
ncbi:hypothetical protein CTAYLR_000823 [Chrysophaeum taylorii]|uniref:CHCH domain-containing protein n=1 Tax=Chrysophaeum taylorii TaxID=2483200 RepID=A0AAD7XQT3_9STRA|nr:hypothetical protein CTAYLR_000823 [Chrysophaeum taylorii]